MAQINGEQKLEEPPTGIVFPADVNGRRSSTIVGKEVLATAISRVDAKAGAAILEEGKWRQAYPNHIYRLVEAGIQSPTATLQIAHDGLGALYDRFEFGRDGTTMPLKDAMAGLDNGRLFTGVVAGEGNSQPGPLTIPYHEKMLTGDSLLREIERWEKQGIVEPSHATALRRVQENPEWLDLSDQTIVLLGAGAEMGPLPLLSQWRANIVAVDVTNPQMWQRLLSMGRQSNGRLLFPLPKPQAPDISDSVMAEQAGCDLLTNTPEICRWLAELEGPLVLGSYAYLDGARHVQVSLAMDALVSNLADLRQDVSLAYLLTPTDVYAISQDAAVMAQARYETWQATNAWSNPKLWQEPLRVLSGGRFFQPNVPEMITAVDGQQYGITDCLVTQQGPNYALAKRLQQWRAVVAQAKDIRVSANVAPATVTHSVVKNQALAAAYAGASRFEIEIFRPETSNALMAALLVHDLRYEGAVTQKNPLELFMNGANHNGLWRTGFASRSVMEIAAILGWTHRNVAA